jgi:hypothetical protein
MLQAFSHLIEFNVAEMKIDSLMPQFAEFIGQFNSIVQSNDINVVTEANGSLSIHVLTSMPDAEAQTIGQRLGILDRVITMRCIEIES